MRYVPAVLGFLIVACGGGDTTGSSYADISGSFAGPISGESQGYVLGATLTLTIVQNGASISGTDAIVGTFDGASISGTGTFTGQIASGNNPSVNVTTSVQGCPTVHATYSGSYSSANHSLTMGGPLYILNNDCSIALTYSLTLVLNK